MVTDRKLKLRIVSPEAVLLEEEVASVTFPGEDGLFGVLPRHAAMLSLSESGKLSARMADGTMLEFVVHDGFVEVRNDQITVLTRSAERPQDIDADRAREAGERAKVRLRGTKEEVDLIRAQAALKRALVRQRYAETRV
ncbi:MAG: F0F1 ATP synthase subunit epsilon [Planctomycetota bacterium]|nr:MAG: F0F1 ATP synthase subunit epsilon [Planctomycetota bacterium]